MHLFLLLDFLLLRNHLLWHRRLRLYKLYHQFRLRYRRQRLPRWFLAVAIVNIVTHPVFTLALHVFGRSTPFVLSCEVAIFLAEALMIMAAYGFQRGRLLFAASLLMNGTSYFTGLLLSWNFA